MKKSYRVKKEKEFQRVFHEGKSCANRNFVVYAINKSEQKHFRIGLSVGKKIGNAVVRNNIKRKIRLITQEMSDEIRADVDFIVIARPNVTTLSMDETRRNLRHVYKLARILKNDAKEGKE